MTLEVNLHDLVASANSIVGHGENYAVLHAAADCRMTAAAPGWAGRSGSALNERLTSWAARTTALLTRIGEQGNAIHTCAGEFSKHEQAGGERLTLTQAPHR